MLARVGVLARQSPLTRKGPPPAVDLFAEAGAEAADGLADLVPAGQLRELDLAERVGAELEVLGFDISAHVMSFYADLLAGLGVVRSSDLADQESGAMILVAGAKVATQTPAVRSGQRIIFASLDDAAGLVDLTFFESVQDRCAARVFGSWLLVARGRVRRAGAGPMAVTLNGTECWDLATLEELRLAAGLDAVRAAMAAGDVGPGTGPSTPVVSAAPADPFDPEGPGNPFDPATGPAAAIGPPPATSAAAAEAAAGEAAEAEPAEAEAAEAEPAEAEPAAGEPAAGEPARRVVFGNGFVLSPYAETGGPGGSIKHPPRTLWHASPGSTATPG
jgi:hypothetical protein